MNIMNMNMNHEELRDTLQRASRSPLTAGIYRAALAEHKRRRHIRKWRQAVTCAQDYYSCTELKSRLRQAQMYRTCPQDWTMDWLPSCNNLGRHKLDKLERRKPR